MNNEEKPFDERADRTQTQNLQGPVKHPKFTFNKPTNISQSANMNDSTKEESFFRNQGDANISSTHPATFKQIESSDSLIEQVNSKLILSPDEEEDLPDSPDELKNLVRVLQKALLETLNQNDYLHAKTNKQEQELREYKTENEAKDRAIIELAAMIDIQKEGLITDALDQLEGSEEDDQEENE